MHALLVQQGLRKRLKGKERLPKSMSNDENEEILAKALGAIPLSVSDEVLWEVAYETSLAGLWLKLESLYDQIPHQPTVYEAATIHSSDA